MNGKQLEVPDQKPFYVSDSTNRCLVAVATLAKNKPQNILVKGRQGCGKSELPAQFAARLNRPFAQFQVGLLAESGQLFGRDTLHNGNVVYESFKFTEALQCPNAVILLDEINRAEHPKALNAIFQVLDDRRSLWIDELSTAVNVAQGVIFFATMNEGVDFTGTDYLDAAIADRFHVIEMSVIPAEHEAELLQQRTGMDADKAQDVVKVVSAIRSADVDVSTRKSIQVAELINTGLDTRTAVLFALGLDRDKLESVFLAMHLTQEQDESVKDEQWIQM
tara:strand:+ start:740 stop:1573 length:834 start_codon:yes stop_codon:yes gene_type:complete